MPFHLSLPIEAMRDSRQCSATMRTECTPRNSIRPRISQIIGNSFSWWVWGVGRCAWLAGYSYGLPRRGNLLPVQFGVVAEDVLLIEREMPWWGQVRRDPGG